LQEWIVIADAKRREDSTNTVGKPDPLGYELSPSVDGSPLARIF
jgi:hypothetical protein